MKKNYTNLSAINIYNRETGYYCPLKIKLFILLFFLIVQTTFSQTFNPVADAYVRDGSYAGTNYGNATTLVVKTGSSGSSGFTRWSYIKFDLTGSGISTAISAKLRLYATAAASFTIGAYKSSSNGWTETGINWNNKPSPGALISSAPISAKNVWYEWDVTSYVTSQLSIGIYSFSFLMKDIATAVKDAGFSSKESSSNKPQLVIITTAPPAAPSSLTTTPVSTSQINLAWNDNAGDETNYAVERKTGNGSYSVIATLPANTIAYNNTGLAEATSYTYRVKAINTGGSSGYSNESTSSTLLSLPNQPTSLLATAVSSSQINLSWVDNATNESGYKIEQSTDNGSSFTEIASLGANATSYNKTGLTPLTLYIYRVRAFNATGYSNYSNEYSATTLAPSALAEYYIDAVNGNDANTGTSSAAPWKNISKLNAMTMSAGAKIFLRAGSVWTGQQLKFNGSGSAANPIVVDKYDAGAKPILHGNGLVGQGVVYLYNQEYIEINNLEITNSPNGTDNSIFFTGLYQNGNNPLGADRRGVMVVIDNFGTANHIYLKNLDIHHIKGQLGSGETSVNGAVPKRTGGIYFCVLGSTETSGSKSRFNDVLIDQCNIYYCENVGLAFNNDWNVYYPGSSEYNDWYSRRFTNIKVSNNIIHHIGKNAMIIRCTDETGLIERNICYETALGTTGNTMFTARAKGTVFQYNEGYYNRATTQNVNPGNNDGSMYDADFGSVGIIFQYSYSHNNSHGLYWGCNTRGSANNTSGTPDPGDTACTVRYNISQNDQGDLIYFNYPSAGNRVYNNVFYIGAGLSPNIIHENSSKQHTYEFYNNIIYNLSSTADYAFATSGQTRYISNNVFYGNHPTGSTTGEPADPNKIILDPLFVNPGSATTNINSTAGYQLQSSSPAINKGKIVPNNGGLDYWGNSLYMGLPDIGAYEYPAGGTTSRNINNNIGMEAQGNDLKSGFDFKIYPNPATNRQLNIILPVNSSFSVVNISILTTDGKEVYHSKVIGGKFIQLNLPTQMSNGIYLLKLKTANSVLTKPFIYDPGN